MFFFDFAQPMQWWAYIVIVVFILVLMIAWMVEVHDHYELREFWKDSGRLKAEIMGESYDLVTFNNGTSYHRIYKSGSIEPASADLVAMVKAHKAAESMGLDPDKLDLIGPIFTRKAPPPVDIDGDGKPAGVSAESAQSQLARKFDSQG